MQNFPNNINPNNLGGMSFPQFVNELIDYGKRIQGNPEQAVQLMMQRGMIPQSAFNQIYSLSMRIKNFLHW